MASGSARKRVKRWSFDYRAREGVVIRLQAVIEFDPDLLFVRAWKWSSDETPPCSSDEDATLRRLFWDWWQISINQKGQLQAHRLEVHFKHLCDPPEDLSEAIGVCLLGAPSRGVLTRIARERYGSARYAKPFFDLDRGWWLNGEEGTDLIFEWPALVHRPYWPPVWEAGAACCPGPARPKEDR